MNLILCVFEIAKYIAIWMYQSLKPELEGKQKGKVSPE
jgi:hypothetical protein